MNGKINHHGIIPKDVHIILIMFDFSLTLESALFDVLSKEERSNALQFIRHTDAIRYAYTRAILRKSLSVAVGEKASNIKFSYSLRGRPSVHSDESVPCIDFNVSHSGNYALIAWSSSRRVGVDIEEAVVDWERLLASVCGDADIREFELTPEAKQKELFFDIWVAKEAFLKAVGEGISSNLRQFSVASSDRVSPFIQGSDDRVLTLQEFNGCWLRGVNGYAACLAWSKQETFQQNYFI